MTKKCFDEMTEFLWKNRKQYANDMKQELNPSEFDFPDYGGLPKYICSKLSPEAVDAMQYIWHSVCGVCWITLEDLKKEEKFRDLREFRSEYKLRLNVLGEKVGK